MQTLVVEDVAGMSAHHAGQHPPQSLPLAVPLLVAPTCNQAKDALPQRKEVLSHKLRVRRRAAPSVKDHRERCTSQLTTVLSLCCPFLTTWYSSLSTASSIPSSAGQALALTCKQRT